jgi:intein-encoded DNA endonuclease-like protein
MHFLHTFFTSFRAEKEKLIVSFNPKSKKLLAEKLKIKQLKKQIQSEIDTKFITLSSLKNSLQNDKISLMTAEIHSIRYEITKIEFEIIRKKERLGELNEQLDLLNLKNYGG